MDKLELVIKTLHKNFAKDIVALDMRLASPLFDTFVICSAENVRLLNAVVEHVQDELAKHDIFVRRIEGNKDSQWILMDYNDIIIHVFMQEERENYHLEKLWLDQDRIDISGYLKDEL